MCSLLTDPADAGWYSTIITFDMHAVLQEKVQASPQAGCSVWKLLYRASTDGFDVRTFHRLVDGHNPTWTVARVAQGPVVGGYTMTPWRGPQRGVAVKDNSAMLFRSWGSDDTRLEVFYVDVARTGQAVWHAASAGPTWGGGAGGGPFDLALMSRECGTVGYSTRRHSVYSGNMSATFGAATSFVLEDIEVYEPVPPIEILEE